MIYYEKFFFLLSKKSQFYLSMNFYDFILLNWWSNQIRLTRYNDILDICKRDYTLLSEISLFYFSKIFIYLQILFQKINFFYKDIIVEIYSTNFNKLILNL